MGGLAGSSQAIGIGDAVWRIGADLSGLRRQLGEAQRSVGQTMQNVGRQTRRVGMAFTAVGGAITGTLGLAVKGAADFQSALAEVRSLGVQDMDALRVAVENAARVAGEDLVVATKAAYQAISAGVPEDNLMSFLDEAARAAVAGVTDMATAVEFGTTAVNVFGGDVEDAFDAAFVAVRDGVTTFGELSSSIGNVAPIFRAAGLELDELLAGVITLSKEGISTSEAMTGLRGVIAAVIRPSSQAVAIAEELGLEFNAAALESKGLAQFLREVEDATEGNVELQAQLFGRIEGLQAVMSLGAESGQNYANALNAMAERGGATSAAFQEIEENDPTLTWARLRTEVSILSARIGDQLLPVLGKIVESLQGVVERLAEWIEENPELTATIIKVVAVIGALLLVLGPVLILMGSLVQSALALKIVLGGLPVAIGLAKTAFIGLSAAVGGVTLAMGGVVVGAGVMVLGLGRLIRETFRLRAANRGLSESLEWADEETKNHIQILEEQGASLDYNAMSTMTLAERQKYLTSVSADMRERRRQMMDDESRQTSEHLRGKMQANESLVSHERWATSEMVGLSDEMQTQIDQAYQLIKNAQNQLPLDVRQSPSVLDRMRSSTSEAVFIFQSMANQIGQIIDSLLGRMHQLGGWIGNLLQRAGMPFFARGGRVGQQANIIAGEEGPELADLPGGRRVLLGSYGPGMYQVPIGTYIHKFADTMRMLASGAPFAGMYARGGTVQTVGYLEKIRDILSRLRVLGMARLPQQDQNDFWRASQEAWLRARQAVNPVVHQDTFGFGARDGRSYAGALQGSGGWLRASQRQGTGGVLSEMFRFARGGRVTGSMATPAGVVVNVNMAEMVVREQADIDRISEQIAARVNRIVRQL